MKKSYTMFGVLFLALFLSTSVFAQNLLNEDFALTLGNLAGQNGWTAHSGTGTNPVQVTNNNLTYPDYSDLGSGNAITIQALSGEDCNKTFTAVTSGSVYASALINVTAATSTLGDYIFHLGTGTSTFDGKLFIRKDGSNFDFGISKAGNATSVAPATPVWTSGGGYALNTTHLIVLKYTIVAGTTNDRVDLYVNPPVLSTEPGSPTLTTTDGNTLTDPAQINAVYVRQGTAAQMSAAIFDAIRVSTTWIDLPLPVELSSFTSNVNGRNIQLNWSTKTEKNSDKFVIERNIVGSNWVAIASVKAAGLSNSTKQYTFSDNNLNAGKYQYRLKMIDNDGTFNYSNVTEVEVSLPVNFELSQNYPNPFNPSTKINYNLPSDSKVTLEIFNMLGVKVGQLVDQNQSAGFYSVNFNSSLNKNITSGVYLYKLTAVDNATGNSFSSVKKMMMLK